MQAECKIIPSLSVLLGASHEHLNARFHGKHSPVYGKHWEYSQGILGLGGLAKRPGSSPCLSEKRREYDEQ